MGQDMPTDDGDALPAAGAIDHAHLRQLVHERVFGDADPVRIGRYTVLERVGTGAMGVVYAAYDNELDRKLAVKVLRAGGRGSQPRLLREAQALARVSNPHVVQVYEVGEQAGEVFVAMELVTGTSLRDWLAAAPRRWDAIVGRFSEAARGLAAAHVKGVVHRDVKPDNIIVGDDDRARIVDFGLAIGADTEDGVAPDSASRLDVGITQTNTTMGTPAYMAPEQIDGSPANPSADQFSLCVAMFEALCGESPFKGQDLGARRRSIAEGPPRWPRAVRVPARVERAVLRGLAQRPADRHASLDGLVEALEPPSRTRRRWALGIGGIATVGALMTGAWLGGASGTSEVPAKAPEVDAPPVDTKLVIAEARNLLATDPTQAWARLATLPDDPAVWSRAARSVAAQADALGIADATWTLGGPQALLQLVGEQALVVDPETCELSLLDADGVEAWRNEGACDLDENRYIGTEWGTMRGPATIDISDEAVLVRRHDALVWSDYARERVVTETFDDFDAASLGPDATVLLVRGGSIELWPTDQRHDVGAALSDQVPALTRVRAAHLAEATAARIAVLSLESEVEANRVALLDLDRDVARALPWEIVHAWPLSLDHAIVQRRDGSLARWRSGQEEDEVLVVESMSMGAHAIAPQGTWLAAITDEDTVALVDLVEGGRRNLTVPGVRDATMSPDGSAVALRCRAAVVVVSATGQILRTLRSSPAATSARWRDASHLVTQSMQAARTWTIPTLPTLRGHRGKADDLAFVDASHLVSIGDEDRRVALWDLQTGQRRLLADGSPDVPIYVSVAPEGRYVLVALHGGDLRAWDLRENQRIELPSERTGGAHFWSPTEVVFGTDDGVTAYDVESGHSRVVQPKAAGCRVLAANALGQVATSCTGGPLRVSNRDGRPLWEDLELSVWIGHLDPSGRFFRPFAFGSSIGGQLLVDLEMHTMRWQKGSPASIDAAFHPARRAMAHSATRGLAITDIDEQTTRELPQTQTDKVTAVAYSSDGTLIAYGTDLGDIRLVPQPVPFTGEALRDHVRERVDRRATIAP